MKIRRGKQPLEIHCDFAHLQIQQLGEPVALTLEFLVHPQQCLQYGMFFVVIVDTGQCVDNRISAVEANEKDFRAGLMIFVMLEIGRDQGKGEGAEVKAARSNTRSPMTVNIIDQLKTFMLMRRNISIRFMLCIYNI
ncbi:hypothetical protein D3C75_1061670 [compost metagenome]